MLAPLKKHTHYLLSLFCLSPLSSIYMTLFKLCSDLSKHTLQYAYLVTTLSNMGTGRQRVKVPQT